MIQRDRYRAVDFCLMYSLPIFLLSTPPEPFPAYWNLVKPFSLGIWIAVFLTLIMVTVSWKFVNYLTRILIGFEFEFDSLDMFKSGLNQSK